MRKAVRQWFVAAALVASVAACGTQATTEAPADTTAPEAPTMASEPGAVPIAPTIALAPPGAAAPAMPAAPAAVTDYETLDSGLQYKILQEGTGVAAKTGDVVEVHYTGWLEDGTVFDSSLEPGRGQPYEFTLGSGTVIPGWELGVLGMKVGEQRQLRIPPALAYGPNGQGPIPANSTLIFDVQLVNVK